MIKGCNFFNPFNFVTNQERKYTQYHKYFLLVVLDVPHPQTLNDHTFHFEARLVKCPHTISEEIRIRGSPDSIFLQELEKLQMAPIFLKITKLQSKYFHFKAR